MTLPYLANPLSGPLMDVERHLLEAMPAVERWLRGEWLEHGAPFYASVDLRMSGFKLAPVDTNLFPGGFNNLAPGLMPLCVQAAMTAVEKFCPESHRMLLVPENHTRNLHYLTNVRVLQDILSRTGLEVRIGSLLPDLAEPLSMELPGGDTLLLEPVKRVGNRLTLEGFDPCAVLLNNDLSGGVPPLLQNLEQMVIPPLHAGWATRRKTRHFDAYSRVARAFAEAFGFDPWLIDPRFAYCGEVDFHARQGEDCLSSQVDFLLAEIRAKYQEYGIGATPFVILKADAGTYGMGIMTVKDAAEVRGLNRKQRNKMAVIKEGQSVSQVMIQEGVHSIEVVNEAVAEPVVYMMDHHVVGGFYRVHTERGPDENLNAPGMHFVPLPFETVCSLPDCLAEPNVARNRFWLYGVVARLALLAASVELEEMSGEYVATAAAA